MLKYFDFIYISFFWLFQKLSRDDRTNIGKPIFVMSIIVLTNSIVLALLTDSLNEYIFNKYIVVGYCLVLIILNYFLFIWKRRYADIQKRFEPIQKKYLLLSRILAIFLACEGFFIVPIYALLFL